jgi:hypothetical protein
MLIQQVIDMHGETIESPYLPIQSSMGMIAYYRNRRLDLQDIERETGPIAPGILQFVDTLLIKVKQVSIEQHFAGCLKSLIEVLNEGHPQLNSIVAIGIRLRLIKDEYKISRQQILAAAIPNFIMFLAIHPSLANGDTNHLLFKKLEKIVNNASNTDLSGSDLYSCIALIKQFKFSGVSQIVLKSDDSLNQQRLDSINFPTELIPEDFFCSLTQQVMTNPCETNSVIVDFTQFIKACEKKGVTGVVYENCYDRQPFDLADTGDLVINNELKTRINLFVEKAKYMYLTFKKEHIKKYKEYKVQLIDHTLPLEAFKLQIMPNNLLNTNKPSPQQQIIATKAASVETQSSEKLVNSEASTMIKSSSADDFNRSVSWEPDFDAPRRWELYQQAKLRGEFGIADSTRNFFEKIPADQARGYSEYKKVIQFGIGLGIFHRTRPVDQKVIGYEYSPTCIKHLSENNIIVRALDLNGHNKDNLDYEAQLETDLRETEPCALLLIRTAEYLHPEALELLLFSMINLAKPGTKIYFETLKTAKEELPETQNHLQYGYVPSFFAPRTDIAFLFHDKYVNPEEDRCSGDVTVERFIAQKL